ncbi:MAG TPA: ABC transporter substrate-binding protein [Acidimicrobiales bacterium]|nr:ABC transporter substrate-binding protein [Acidimicrobiales bacterium]
MTGSGQTRALVAAALVALAVLAAACSSSSSGSSGSSGSGATGGATVSPSMSSTKTACPNASACFTSANIATIGGIVPGLFKGALVGTDAYLAYQNSLGGLDGRKFKLLSGDDQFSCNLNQSLTQQFLSQVIAFTGSFSLQDNCGGQVLTANPTMPNVSETLNTTTSQLPNTFSPSPLKPGWQLGPLEYYKAHFPNAVTHVGELIAGVPSSQTQAAGQDAAMKSVGFQIVYSRTYGPLETDFTADVIKMQQAGVQAVNLTAIDAPHAAKFMQEAHTQGFHPALVFSGGPIYTPDFVQQSGGPAAVNGSFLNQTQALYLGQDAGTVPAVNQFLKWVHGLYPGFAPDIFTIYGWTSAALYVQALKSAGADPTSQTLLAALGQVHAFTADGLLAQSDPAGKQPPSCYLLAKIVNGQFQRTDMPASGFKCDAPYFSAP